MANYSRRRNHPLYTVGGNTRTNELDIVVASIIKPTRIGGVIKSRGYRSTPINKSFTTTSSTFVASKIPFIHPYVYMHAFGNLNTQGTSRQFGKRIVSELIASIPK